MSPPARRRGTLSVGIFSSATTALASLVAVGTPDKKILFTSAETTGAAGDWLGLRFGDIPTGTNKVAFATVAFAGGTSSTGSGSCLFPGQPINDAAIRFSGPPPAQFVTDTIISDSLTNAFDRGYRADEKIDFQPSNMFVRIGKCLQTYPKDANGACPDASMIPCPK